MKESKRPHVAIGEARGVVEAVRALRAGDLGLPGNGMESRS